MRVDLYTAAGTKKGTIELPASLFEAKVNEGLMHEYLLLQQSNRRHPVAHAKTRGEVAGSTRKLYRQKGTGRARRGMVRSPIVRGGGKAFGPQKERNFRKTMTRKARRAALCSCLTFRAQKGTVLALDPAPPQGSVGQEGLLTGKTKSFAALLRKLPVEVGRKIVFVLPERMGTLERGSRNVPGVKTLLVRYLNPEDVLGAHSLVFLKDALKVAEEMFGKKAVVSDKSS